MLLKGWQEFVFHNLDEADSYPNLKKCTFFRGEGKASIDMYIYLWVCYRYFVFILSTIVHLTV